MRELVVLDYTFIIISFRVFVFSCFCNCFSPCSLRALRASVVRSLALYFSFNSCSANRSYFCANPIWNRRATFISRSASRSDGA
jgi:hypothetical protein